jgi:hypothetical protein
MGKMSTLTIAEFVPTAVIYKRLSECQKLFFKPIGSDIIHPIITAQYAQEITLLLFLSKQFVFDILL